MGEMITFKAGQFVTLRATRSFHIGEIAKKYTGAQSDIRLGETIDFDGEHCVFRGTKYKAPGLVGAVKLNWLVAQDSDYEVPAVPVVRDEVSRPLGSSKEEPQVVYTGLKLEDYKFNAHWRVRQKTIEKIDSVEVLKEILKRESGKFIPYIEKRISEVETALQKAKRETLRGAVGVESDSTLDLLKALDEVVEVTDIKRDQIIQTPNGKKIRKPLQRDVMEQNEVSRPTAAGKEKKAQKEETKITRDDSLIEGTASGVKQVSRQKGRANRSTKK